MKMIIQSALISAMAIALGGCIGPNFTRAALDELVLGKTTFADIKSRLGESFSKSVVLKNEKKIDVLNYVHSRPGAGALQPARAQTFYFFEDNLIGYEFSSSYGKDKTDFQGANVPQIKQNLSTRADVERLFGRPGGKYIYPMVPNKDDQAVVYSYHQSKDVYFRIKMYHQVLIVTLNKQNVVTNIDYTESGEK